MGNFVISEAIGLDGNKHLNSKPGRTDKTEFRQTQ